jgi:hypothetical protein
VRPPIRIDWSDLGFTPGDAPRHIGLQIAPARAVADIAAGAITDGSLFVRGARGALMPISGGLFDERVFGPFPRGADGSLSPERAAGVDPRKLPQARRFGAFRLPAPVVHPWLLRHAPLALVEAAGLEDAYELSSLLSGMRAAVPRGDGSWELARAEDGDDPPGAVYGAEAFARLAGDRLPDGSVLTQLPLLPAGLRPVRPMADGDYLTHDITILYQYLVRYHARWERLLELDASPLLLRGQARIIAEATAAVLTDGLVETGDDDSPYEPTPVEEDDFDEEDEDIDEEDDGDEEGEGGDESGAVEPDIQPIAAFLRGQDGETQAWFRQLDEAVAENPRVLSASLPGAFHHLRAWIDASALELVPLREDGEVDEEQLERVRINRLAQRFSEAYDAILGIDFVWHPSHERPHADVYVTPPRPDGTRLLVTGGMSSAPMPGALLAFAHPHVEIALVARADLGRDVLERLAHDLALLARYPTRSGAFFAHGHDVRVPRPIASSGSGRESLSAWILLGADGAPWDALSAATPRSPKYLLAVGITEAEWQLRARGGLSALEPLLRGRLRLMTEPERASLV